MSDTKKADDRDRFEAELAEARDELGGRDEAPAGAEAFPSVKDIWGVLAKALSDPAVVKRLWDLWQALHGGGQNPTPAPAPAPPPPPEPAS
jgi:hypothetical protein